MGKNPFMIGVDVAERMGKSPAMSALGVADRVEKSLAMSGVDELLAGNQSAEVLANLQKCCQICRSVFKSAEVFSNLQKCFQICRSVVKSAEKIRYLGKIRSRYKTRDNLLQRCRSLNISADHLQKRFESATLLQIFLVFDVSGAAVLSETAEFSLSGWP